MKKQKREAHAPRRKLQFLVSFPKPTRLAVGLGHMGSVLRKKSRFAPCPKFLGVSVPPRYRCHPLNSRVGSLGVIKLSRAKYYAKIYKEVIKMRK